MYVVRSRIEKDDEGFVLVENYYPLEFVAVGLLLAAAGIGLALRIVVKHK